MTVSGVNFGKAASDYGTFRVGFPDSFFDRLDDFGIGFAGQRSEEHTSELQSR